MAQPSDHRPFTHRVPVGAGVMPLVPSAHMSRGGAAYRGTGRADTVGGDVADGLALGRSDVQEASKSDIATSASQFDARCTCSYPECPAADPRLEDPDPVAQSRLGSRHVK